MNNTLKVMSVTAMMLVPASAFAQDAFAVALGAAFQPVETTSSFESTQTGGTVTIPSQEFNGTSNTNVPILGFPVNRPGTVTGTIAAQDVVLPDTTYTGTSTTSSMELTSVSVAAASGRNAAASATANANGATSANSGSSTSVATLISATTTPVMGGSSYTSEVLVGQQVN